MFIGVDVVDSSLSIEGWLWCSLETGEQGSSGGWWFLVGLIVFAGDGTRRRGYRRWWAVSWIWRLVYVGVEVGKKCGDASEFWWVAGWFFGGALFGVEGGLTGVFNGVVERRIWRQRWGYRGCFAEKNRVETVWVVSMVIGGGLVEMGLFSYVVIDFDGKLRGDGRKQRVYW